MQPLTLTRQQLATRRKQAAALFAEDLSNAEIGRRLGISRPTLSKWRQKFHQDGQAGLALSPPGTPARLTPEQVEQGTAARLLGAEAQGYSTPLWMLERIRHLIADLTGVTYPPGHVWHLLQEWDGAWQKPEALAKERDQADIARWLTEEWPRIKRGQNSEGPSEPSSMRADFPSKPRSDAPGRRVDRPRWCIRI
jgi:transposase